MEPLDPGVVVMMADQILLVRWQRWRVMLNLTAEKAELSEYAELRLTLRKLGNCV